MTAGSFSLSEQKAEIQSQTLPPKFTNIKLLFKLPDVTLMTAGVYGKVVGRSTKDGSFVLHFTAVPPEAGEYFIGLEPVAPLLLQVLYHHRNKQNCNRPDELFSTAGWDVYVGNGQQG